MYKNYKGAKEDLPKTDQFIIKVEVYLVTKNVARLYNSPIYILMACLCNLALRNLRFKRPFGSLIIYFGIPIAI